MEQDIMHVLLNGGSNVAFAMFLLWQYKEQQKRADDREIKNDNKERELRDRYDKVIEGYQQKEEATRDKLGKEMQDVERRLGLLEQRTEYIKESVDEIKQKFLRVS